MKRLLGLALIALFWACSGSPSDSEGVEGIEGGDEIRSDKQRITTPQIAPADFEAQVAGNNGFAWEAYQQVRTEDGNLFFSPYSISSCVAMLQAGARNNTEQQIADVLHYLPQNELHPAFNKLDLALHSRGQGKKSADGKAFQLNIVNATWGQRDYTFIPEYLDTLAVHYGAGLRTLDFQTDPNGSRETINQWVEDQTEKRIKDLLPPPSITPATTLVLTNAIYFNAAWAEPFKKNDTAKAPFDLLDGTQVQVDMMSGYKEVSFAKDTNFEAVSVPYDGNELSMLILLPDKGKFETFEKTLDAKTVDQIVAKLQVAGGNLKLPKFEVDHTLPLKKTLKALGITDVFDPAGKADLSGINGGRDLYVSNAFHKAFVKVNEAGTEAAAATAIVVARNSGPPKVVDVTIDRPFIFLIRDHATNTTLFVGRIVEP